jgi:hypothetical protein
VLGTDGTKYTRHSSGEEQLFDLHADPAETAPLLGRELPRRTHALELLADALAETADSARGAPVGFENAGEPR